MARGHRRKVNGIRIAGIGLALAGAGLTVAGVASAKVVDGPNDNQTVLPSVTISVGALGGDNGSGDSTAPTQSATPSQDAAPTQGGTGTASGAPSAASSSSASAAGSSATTSAVPSAGGTGGTGGTGGSTGGVPMTPAPGRTQLAETGSDNRTPMILAGGFTFVLGGAVFRFGPRAASSRKH